MADFKTIAQLGCIPRGEKEEIRLSLDESTGQRGTSTFVNVRVWFRGDDDQMHPGKQGMSIRKGEIHDFGKALRAALDAMNGEAPAPRHPPVASAPPPPRQPPRQTEAFDMADDDERYPF